MKGLYLLLHVFTISFPLIRSFEPRIQYAKKWRSLFPAICLTATFFLIWDILFTSQGVWGFNPVYTTGINLLKLPIEEWMFFFTVPFASVFIYESVNYFFPQIKSTPTWRTFNLMIAACLIVIAIMNRNSAYTYWNFTFTGAFLILVFFLNPAWLGRFWIAYFIQLIPFTLVNGILTGSFLSEPVVWYNDEENLGIRIITIPIEDTIYALLLLLMNITIYEHLNKRLKIRT